MPTYPIVRPDGTRARLTAPQWRVLCDLARRLEQRPLLDNWLLGDLYPPFTKAYNDTRPFLARLVQLGVLEARATGYHLPVRIRAQVVSADATTSAL